MKRKEQDKRPSKNDAEENERDITTDGETSLRKKRRALTWERSGWEATRQQKTRQVASSTDGATEPPPPQGKLGKKATHHGKFRNLLAYDTSMKTTANLMPPAHTSYSATTSLEI